VVGCRWCALLLVTILITRVISKLVRYIVLRYDKAMSKVISTIARTTVANFAGKPIAIEVVLGENGFYGVISNGMTDGKVYLTEAEARAAANRVWKHIRAHAA